MGHNGKDEILVCETEPSGCSEATVEIKIKTLDSQTYTLRVDKCVPVPALKEQIASVTGVVSEQQRLICRGKVLKDDQLLSAYHVEDGHTLHLVVRQAIPPLSESLTDYPAADPASSAVDSQGSQRPRVVVGSFNISEQEDGVFSDLSQLVSAVLGSLGIASTETSIEGLADVGSSHERLSRQSGSGVARYSTRGQSGPANAVNQSSIPLTPPQPPVIPDSLTTLSEYLNHLRHEFVANGGNGNNLQASGTSSSNMREFDLAARQSGLPRPSHLAEVLQSTRNLLISEVAECLSSLVRQLEDHVNVTDPSVRTRCQLNMLQSGVLLENLGALLLELGRTTMMLRLGQTPEDAVVNAGPAVFISPSGPNPIMVQPHPSRLGTNFGAVPTGNAQPSSLSGGSLGSGPRNIEIRIRTGSWMPSAGVNQREEGGTPQSPGQTNPAVSGVTNSIPTMRGISDSSRSPVALVIPVLARYQHASSGERSSSGLDGTQQQSSESATQPQNTGFPGEGDNNGGTEIPRGQGLSELSSRINQLLRPMTHYEQSPVGSLNSQTTTNSFTVSADTNETAVTNAQEAAPTVSEEGTFLSSVLQQIMPFISQNMATTSDRAPAETDSRSSRQASSRQGQGSNAGTSSRAEPPSPPDAKRQKRE